MLGGFIMHPRTPYHPHCDKDFLLHLQEYEVLPNNTVPNTMNMEYNWLLLNGKAGPASTPLIVRQGERDPILPDQVAHCGAGSRPGQEFIVFDRQHDCYLPFLGLAQYLCICEVVDFCVTEVQ